MADYVDKATFLAKLQRFWNNTNTRKVSKSGDTMTGDLETRALYPDQGNTRDLGTEAKPYKTLFVKYLALGGKVAHNAGFHNSIYRGKDVTSYWNDGTIHKRIQGTDGFALFEDLYVGDYFSTGSATINGVTKTWWWIIAGFDLRLGVGSNNVGSHHLVLLPCNSSGTATEGICNSKMYEATPFTTAYQGSLAHQLMISGGAIATGLQGIFGSNLLPSSELISTANNNNGYGRHGSASGVSSSWAWVDVYATLLSEVEAYGSIVWSSSGYDGGMSSRGQLPLFRLCPNLISNRSYFFWLRDVSDASYFAYVSTSGHAYPNPATAEFALRPRFLIK